MLENGPGVFSGFYFSVVCENWRIWEYSYNVGGCRFFVLASDDFFVWWIAQVIWGPDWLTNSHGFSLVEIICQSTDDGFLRLTDGIWSSAIDVVIELSPSSFIHSTLKLETQSFNRIMRFVQSPPHSSRKHIQTPFFGCLLRSVTWNFPTVIYRLIIFFSQCNQQCCSPAFVGLYTKYYSLFSSLFA